MPPLDGLRGVAILLVLVHHFVLSPPTGPITAAALRLADLGKYGVDLFFVLSGFLITGILLDSKGRTGYFRNFYARRTLRIFPLYYALLIVFLVILPRIYLRSMATLPKAMGLAAEARDWPWYFGYASNLLFAAGNRFGPQGLDVTWSLAIEEQFYLLWAVAVFFLPRGRFLVMSAVVVVAAPLFRLVAGLAGASWTQVYLLTPGRLDALAAGAFLAAFLRHCPERREQLVRMARWVAGAAAVALILLLAGGQLTGLRGAGMVAGLSFVALLSAAGMVLTLFAPAAGRSARVLGGGALAFFGRYSYGLYLVHVPVRNILRRTVFPEWRFENRSDLGLLGMELLFLALGIVAASVVALLSRHLFENRFLALKKYFQAPQPARS